MNDFLLLLNVCKEMLTEANNQELGRTGHFYICDCGHGGDSGPYVCCYCRARQYIKEFEKKYSD